MDEEKSKSPPSWRKRSGRNPLIRSSGIRTQKDNELPKNDKGEKGATSEKSLKSEVKDKQLKEGKNPLTKLKSHGKFGTQKDNELQKNDKPEIGSPEDGRAKSDVYEIKDKKSKEGRNPLIKSKSHGKFGVLVDKESPGDGKESPSQKRAKSDGYEVKDKKCKEVIKQKGVRFSEPNPVKGHVGNALDSLFKHQRSKSDHLKVDNERNICHRRTKSGLENVTGLNMVPEGEIDVKSAVFGSVQNRVRNGSPVIGRTPGSPSWTKQLKRWSKRAQSEGQLTGLQRFRRKPCK